MFLNLIEEEGRTFADLSMKKFNTFLSEYNFQIDVDNTEIDIDDNINEFKEIFFDYFGDNFQKDYKKLNKSIDKMVIDLGLINCIDAESFEEIHSAKWNMNFLDKNKLDVLINWTK